MYRFLAFPSGPPSAGAVLQCAGQPQTGWSHPDLPYLRAEIPGALTISSLCIQVLLLRRPLARAHLSWSFDKLLIAHPSIGITLSKQKRCIRVLIRPTHLRIVACINDCWRCLHLSVIVYGNGIKAVTRTQALCLPKQAAPGEEKKMAAIGCPSTIGNRLK